MAASTAAFLLAGEPAGANGYLFFDEKATALRLSYVGAVVDTRGRAVSDAQVAITVRPIGYTIFLTTDDQGLYRSTSAPSSDISQIRITASKAGYRLVKSVSLNPTPAPGRPLAINFIFAKR